MPWASTATSGCLLSASWDSSSTASTRLLIC